MRFLKLRRVQQAAPHEGRTTRLTVIRWIYIIIVLGLFVWLFDVFFGGLFYLKSEGMVTGEPGIVAAEYTVTVTDLMIREGEIVKEGQVAAVVSSQSVAESIARLSAEFAVRQSRLSELRIRSEVVHALLPLAENRQKVATYMRGELERLLTSGHTSLNQRMDAVDKEYRAQHDLAMLAAEGRTLEAEINALKAAWSEADKAIHDLREGYDKGRLRSPVEGMVGHRLVSKGSVVRAGSPLFEIYSSDLFVLAYVPTGTFYEVWPGDKVLIETGLRTYRGTVQRVEPYAAALPREFQEAFTPVARQQVMRITFDAGEVPPPLFSKVTIRSLHFARRWFYRLWPNAAPIHLD